MTLKTRIIPCLDVKDGRIVKGVQFVDLRDAGDPAEAAIAYDAAGADELCFLDISASHEGRGVLLDKVALVAERCFMPLTVGGGVASTDDFRRLLLTGADKVAINTAAVRDPDLVARAADAFGAQCVVVAIDARRVDKGQSGGGQSAEGRSGESRDGKDRWEIFTHGGRNATGIDAIEFAARVSALGAGEILLTSMDADGSKAGYDLELTRRVAEAVTVPVIASGGAGTLQHLVDAVIVGKASAVLAASIFHFGEFSIAEARAALRAAGASVRSEEAA